MFFEWLPFLANELPELLTDDGGAFGLLIFALGLANRSDGSKLLRMSDKGELILDFFSKCFASLLTCRLSMEIQ